MRPGPRGCRPAASPATAPTHTQPSPPISPTLPLDSTNAEHDPEKWMPVFGKDHAQNKKLERDDDSKKSHPAPERVANPCRWGKPARRRAMPQMGVNKVWVPALASLGWDMWQ